MSIPTSHEQALALAKRLVHRQLESLFAVDREPNDDTLDQAADAAFERCVRCFDSISNNYFRGDDGTTRIDPLHSGQYSIFLYYLSNTLSKGDGRQQELAEYVYLLNKALNGLDVYHEVELPGIFFVGHTVGTVLGRARYSDYFFFGGNCTVGNNRGAYPEFGRNVHLMSGARVLGRSKIGDHVVFSANSHVIDTDVPSCSIVFGASPDLVVKEMPVEYFVEFGNSCFVLPADLSGS